jgi:hypothetical protein
VGVGTRGSYEEVKAEIRALRTETYGFTKNDGKVEFRKIDIQKEAI